MSFTLWDKIEKEIRQKHPKTQNIQETAYKTQIYITEIVIYYLNIIIQDLQHNSEAEAINKHLENKDWIQIIAPYIKTEAKLSQNPLHYRKSIC